MVHTRPFSAAEHMPHVPRLHCVAMSTDEYFAYIRRYHAQQPERADEFYTRMTRMNAVSPDHVIRVAIADDADPFTDLGLDEARLWMAGSWVNGNWISEDSKVPDPKRKVAEGRVLGFATWSRVWPSDSEIAKQARESAGDIWPLDSPGMKLKRTIYSLADKMSSIVCPDPAEDPERVAKVYSEGVNQYFSIAGPVTDQLDEILGYIFCPIVAVDPAFQRKGIGTRLMRWGLVQAEKEGVPILLTASQGGARMYEKLGFETLGTISFDGLSGERVMVYWPGGAKHIQHANA